MNQQNRRDLTQIMAQLDETTGKPHSPMRQVPPAYGEPQRDAIASVVDGITQDVSRKIDALRRRLDEIEQLVLTGAADAKVSLNEQISVCIKINDEIEHMGRVIEELAARGRDE